MKKMVNGEYEIDEDTFKRMPVDDQNWIMYRTFNAHRIACNLRLCQIESRSEKLEKRRYWNTTVGAGSGIVGGALAYIAGRFTGMFGGN